jgi:acetolactate synthase-1/2/3 large subunit
VYKVLETELARMGAENDGAKAKLQLKLTDPNLDFVKLGIGLGVPSRRADAGEQLIGAPDQAIADPYPRLIEVVIPAAIQPSAVAGYATGLHTSPSAKAASSSSPSRSRRAPHSL